MSVGPDCTAGKHAACSGDGWDHARDEMIACACNCHGLTDSGRFLLSVLMNGGGIHPFMALEAVASVAMSHDEVGTYSLDESPRAEDILPPTPPGASCG